MKHDIQRVINLLEKLSKLQQNSVDNGNTKISLFITDSTFILMYLKEYVEYLESNETKEQKAKRLLKEYIDNTPREIVVDKLNKFFNYKVK